MKILDLRTIRAEIPLAKPIKTAIHKFHSIGNLAALDRG